MMVAFQMAKAKAMANEFLKQGHQFRENTAVRHGLQQPSDVTEIDINDVEKIFNMQQPPPPQPVPEQPKVASPPENTTQQQRPQIGKPTEKKSLLQTLGPSVVLATGLLGGSYLIGSELSKKPVDPPAVAPAVTPAITPAVQPSRSGDLIPYLRLKGYNLPPVKENLPPVSGG